MKFALKKITNFYSWLNAIENHSLLHIVTEAKDVYSTIPISIKQGYMELECLSLAFVNDNT